jgi:hypothetical protein
MNNEECIKQRDEAREYMLAKADKEIKNEMKDKIKDIMARMDAIPKSEDKQVECNNLFPLAYELHLLKKQDVKLCSDCFMEIVSDKQAERILPCISENQNWKEYRDNRFDNVYAEALKEMKGGAS